jgi:hypothetical protein
MELKVKQTWEGTFHVYDAKIGRVEIREGKGIDNVSFRIGDPALSENLDWKRLEEAAGVAFNEHLRESLGNAISWLAITPLPPEDETYDLERRREIQKDLKTVGKLAAKLLSAMEPITEREDEIAVSSITMATIRIPDSLPAVLRELINNTKLEGEKYKKCRGPHLNEAAYRLQLSIYGIRSGWKNAGGQGRGCSMPNTYTGKWTGGLFNLIQEIYRQLNITPPTGGQIDYALDALDNPKHSGRYLRTLESQINRLLRSAFEELEREGLQGHKTIKLKR